MGAFLSNTTGASFRGDQGNSSAARDYRRTRDDYSRAMRMLRRSKDPNDALKMIDLRNKARESGIQIGGIRRSENEAGNARGYAENLSRVSADRERLARINRGEDGGAAGGAAGEDAGGAAGGGLARGRDTRSFAEIEQEARKRSEESGAFGTKSPRIQQMEEQRRANALVNSYERGDISEEEAVGQASQFEGGSDLGISEAANRALQLADERNATREKNRSAADSLMKDYEEYKVSDADLYERGMAIGGTKASIDARKSEIDARNTARAKFGEEERAQAQKVAERNKQILDEAYASGRLKR